MSRATIASVAREAHVSTTAISLYLHERPGLSEETRQRIAQVIEKLGYTQRRQRKGKTTALIGLLVEELPLPIFSETYSELVRGLERQARQAGYHTLLMPVGPQENTSIPRLVADGQVAGLIALGGGDITDAILAPLVDMPVPLVLVDNYLFTRAANCVLSDNEMGALLITRHLIDRGHRRIAVIMGPPKYKPLGDRLQGYLRAMAEAGLLEAGLLQPPLSQEAPTKGYREMRALLDRPQRPTAVFCVSDRTAFGALMALKEAGLRVPDDIALAGFDDVRDSANTDPPLTTAHMPKLEMGVVAAQRLIDLIRHPLTEGPPLKLVLPTRVVLRATT